MSTLISDFMGDELLVNLAESLVKKDSARFSHLISHKVPRGSSILGGLEFIDATSFYEIHALKRLIGDKSSPFVPLEYLDNYGSKMPLIMLAMDRTLPMAKSSHEIQGFLWTLFGYFYSLFNENNDIDSIIFDNTPHLPWELCLFFVAKSLGKKVLFLRRTGLGGYIYIDEDFRPGKGNWSFSYKNVNNSLDKSLSLNCIETLRSLSFTKSQKNGAWPIDVRKKEAVFINILSLLRRFGFQSLITNLRVLIKPVPNNASYATLRSSQNTVLAGLGQISRWQYLKIHFKYQGILKKLEKFYFNIADRVDDINKHPYIYVALHYQPERTTMPEGGWFENQLLMIDAISRALPNNLRIVVKEHPRQFNYDLRSMNARSIDDYTKLSKYHNVFVAPITMSQQELVDGCLVTVTVAGSVGWEGLLLGKPSIVFSDIWHASCKSCRFIQSDSQIQAAISELIGKSCEEVLDDVCSFINKISHYLVNGALNSNHLRIFFGVEDQKRSEENIVSAILQRLN